MGERRVCADALGRPVGRCSKAFCSSDFVVADDGMRARAGEVEVIELANVRAGGRLGLDGERLMVRLMGEPSDRFLGRPRSIMGIEDGAPPSDSCRRWPLGIVGNEC